MKKYLLVVLLFGCTSARLPPPAPVALAVQATGEFAGDTLLLTARNRTAIPLLFRLQSDLPAFQPMIPREPIHLGAYATQTFKIGPIPDEKARDAIGPSLRFRPLLDTTSISPDPTVRYQYPFLPSRSYTVMQGYQGTVSHNRPSSRYAIDFALPVGDTVCAARDGIVIEQVDQNTLHGPDRRYEAYANYLSLYHADGVITQYVHLAPEGVLVHVGDSVRVGQPIGIVGLTGYTTAPHLHFNVCVGIGEQRRSIPVQFIDRAGVAIRSGDFLQRKE